MEFIQVVARRRMVREFTDEPIPNDVVMQILEVAHRSPSAGHLQPQEFIIVRNAEQKRKLARAALSQMFIAQAPVVIVVCSDTRRNVWRYGKRGRDFYSIIDGAFASMLILLACTNLGLGACFVGAFDDEEVSRVLNLPCEVRPIGIIPIGKSAKKPEKLGRRPLKEIIHYEQW
ncbi:MAG: nitroreductase family protein [Aigarchaeota archaeon]|nr:nitroreductase family protein [Candidatus Pelearchaeum maunauluense]